MQLHEEHVNVERHAVNRPLTAADTAAFKEESFELREKAEEAVISKQARIVEEVVVGKTATDRTETVHDTVRRTDVEVEHLDTQHTSRSGQDTRGTTEKIADTVTGTRIDDKTGKPIA